MSRQPVPRRNLGRSWTAGLVMALSGLAQAGEGFCSGGQCGATGISPALLRKAVRGAGAEAPLAPQPALPLPQQDARRPADTAWERRFGASEGREAWDCALSFGAGASLGGDGFLATRLLGRTRVWRASEAR
ncbi:MAG: hypothetical protein EOP92_11025 [Lysobacteraceae bacterium]|nr:MAG: hypothetical protein EOP92_11025 [Xanthomonadaceae bacterium]